jgi:hypothetical protein
MNLRALKFVRFDRIEDHFRQGWIVSFANAPMHHHHYGAELAWICDCPVPGGFVPHRVPNPQTENAINERAEGRT